MLSFSTLALATADANIHERNTQTNFPREWQSTSMDHFYAAISDVGKMILSKEYRALDYCDWNGVVCDGGVVCEVAYDKTRHGNFHIDWLPLTIEIISINSSKQEYVIQTRRLPRELQKCVMVINQLFRPLDLHTLPSKLIHLDFYLNKLSGPIALTGLPCNLEVLLLHGNLFVQPVVYYDDLPPNIRSIQLVKVSNVTNKIGKVCAVHPDMAVKTKRVFWPFANKNIC